MKPANFESIASRPPGEERSQILRNHIASNMPPERSRRQFLRRLREGLAGLSSLDALTSPGDLANHTPGWEGILKHGVYHTAKNLGVDESVMWGEYFFVEGLMKAMQ